MTPSGAQAALAQAYKTARGHAVAFIDETYSVDAAHELRFYVMAAVVVRLADVDGLRSAMEHMVGHGFWHTTEALRSDEGRRMARDLLAYLGDPVSREVCVVRHEESIEDDDEHGERARARCLTALIAHLARPGTHGEPVHLLVVERRHSRAAANVDARTKSDAVSRGLAPDATRMVQVSPGDEHLLWLPDLVCSAYRQTLVRGATELFDEVAAITTVI